MTFPASPLSLSNYLMHPVERAHSHRFPLLLSDGHWIAFEALETILRCLTVVPICLRVVVRIILWMEIVSSYIIGTSFIFHRSTNGFPEKCHWNQISKANGGVWKLISLWRFRDGEKTSPFCMWKASKQASTREKEVDIYYVFDILSLLFPFNKISYFT